jgi:hypothetical protein
VSQHHDPVHPEGPHLDAEVIADLRADALDAESAQHARDHLDHCPQCQEIAAGLDDVDTLLADLPAVTAPDDVVDRWLAALAAEPVPAPAAGGATVVPLGAATGRRTSSFANRGLAIAASAAGLLLVAALAYPLLTDNGSSGGGGATTATVDGPESSPVVIPAAMTSGTQYQPASLNAQVSTQLASAQTTDLVSATPSPLTTTFADDSASPLPSANGTAGTGGTSGTPSGSDGLRAPIVGNPAAELACISNVMVAGQTPILVDVASFAGKAAVVVVVPTDNDPTKMDIWVLARHCTATEYRVLYWSRTDRP